MVLSTTSACVWLALLGASSALVVQRGLQAPPLESSSSGLHAENQKIKEMNLEKGLTRKCGGAPKKTVAMIISGLESRLLLNSKLRNVVEPLAASGVSVDLYIDVLATSLGEGKQFTPVTGWKQSSDLTVMQEELPEYLKKHCGSLQSVNVRQERDAMDIPPQSVPQKWLKKRNGGYKNETVRNVFRRYSSYKLMLDKIASQESQRGYSYDFVLVTRDDDDWLGELQLADILKWDDAINSMFSKNCKAWGGVNDMTLLLGRQAAEKILGGMFPSLMDPSIHDLSRSKNAEGALKMFADIANVTRHPVNFRNIPTVCAVYVPSDSQPGEIAICHKFKALCETEGWDLHLCKYAVARYQVQNDSLTKP